MSSVYTYLWVKEQDTGRKTNISE